MKSAVITILVLMCSQAFGLTFMGQPKAGLKQGQKSVGFDYSYGDMDMKFSFLGRTGKLEGVESSAKLVNLGYGITDNWEVFARLGFVDIENEESTYGFGIKSTFSQEDSLSFGGLFQAIWSRVEETELGVKAEVDYCEIQIAVGPTYEAGNLKIYGGAFLHYINGDLELSVPGYSETAEFEQSSVFGGYVGLSTEIMPNTDLILEFQATGDAQVIGFRLVRRF